MFKYSLHAKWKLLLKSIRSSFSPFRLVNLLVQQETRKTKKQKLKAHTQNLLVHLYAPWEDLILNIECKSQAWSHMQRSLYCTHMLSIYMEVMSLRARSSSSVMASRSVSVRSSVGAYTQQSEEAHVGFCGKLSRDVVTSAAYLPNHQSSSRVWSLIFRRTRRGSQPEEEQRRVRFTRSTNSFHSNTSKWRGKKNKQTKCTKDLIQIIQRG